MRRILAGDYVHWHARITLRHAVEEAVRRLASEDARSVGTMIGILLAEAVTTRSSA